MTVFKLEQSEQWRQHVAGKTRKAALRGLLSTALRLVGHIQSDIIPSLVRVPVARGAYRAAWRAERIDNGASVMNTIPHAVFIEYGVQAGSVRPGRKMIQALAEWVRMKGIGGRVTKGGKMKRATMTEAVGIAWAIAKSMQRRGIFGGKGLGVMRTAMKKANVFAQEEVAREIKKEFGS